MALQAEPRTSCSSNAGLPIYWQEATKPSELEWEKWIDLFEVALMAKSNISVADLTKTTGTKNKRLMGDIEAATAMKKANSVLYLALGMAARKTISDKFPAVIIARITLEDLIKICKECFEKPKYETLDRFKVLSRKHKENETSRQFWNEFNGLAARYNFGNALQCIDKLFLAILRKPRQGLAESMTRLQNSNLCHGKFGERCLHRKHE